VKLSIGIRSSVEGILPVDFKSSGVKESLEMQCFGDFVVYFYKINIPKVLYHPK